MMDVDMMFLNIEELAEVADKLLMMLKQTADSNVT